MATMSIIISRHNGTTTIATSTGVDNTEAGATVPFALGLTDEDESGPSMRYKKEVTVVD